MSGAEAEKLEIVPLESLRKFAVQLTEKAGAKTEHAQVLADLLIAADHRGHFSHGMNRLGKSNILIYIKFSCGFFLFFFFFFIFS